MRKYLIIACIIGIGTGILSMTSLSAQEKGPHDLSGWKKKGFFLGGELSGLIGFYNGVKGFQDQTVSGHGKIDLLIGYQLNPYVSLNIDAWALDLVVYGIEFNPRINFTESKISPFLTASVGISVNGVCEETSDCSPITYSAGIGTDIHLSRKGTLFAEAKYRGFNGPVGGEAITLLNHGLELGVGFRWTF
jgi:opacity protein-like surface antigen